MCLCLSSSLKAIYLPLRDLEGDQITAAVTQADLSCQPAVLTTSLEDQSQKQRKESSGGTSDFACPFCGNHTSWADCKCLNYSRVFNARNSFASIAQQSTPLAQVQHCNNNHKNVTFVETSEDFDSQLFFTPLRSSTSARDCDAALDNSQKEGAGLMLDKANEDDCGSQAMSQLATQLSECVLSPCVKLKESSILASDSKRSLTESLSLGYIPTAFPEDSS